LIVETPASEYSSAEEKINSGNVVIEHYLSYRQNEVRQLRLSARIGFRVETFSPNQNQSFGFSANQNPMALKMEFFCLSLTFLFLP
jgi:hypothetical protein